LETDPDPYILIQRPEYKDRNSEDLDLDESDLPSEWYVPVPILANLWTVFFSIFS
jgi:hypothetical protein